MILMVICSSVALSIISFIYKGWYPKLLLLPEVKFSPAFQVLA